MEGMYDEGEVGGEVEGDAQLGLEGDGFVEGVAEDVGVR